MTAFEAANRRLLRRTGFFLLVTAGITLAALAGAGPAWLLLLSIVAILSFLATVEGLMEQETARPGRDTPGNLEEGRFMAAVSGTAGAMALLVTGIHVALTGEAVPRTGTVFSVSVGLMALALVAYPVIWWREGVRRSSERAGKAAILPLGGRRPTGRDVHDQMSGKDGDPEKERTERELALKHGAGFCAKEGHDWDIIAAGGGSWAFECARPGCKLTNDSERGYLWDGQPA